MSDIKVSEMAEATTLNDNDLLMVVQNGTNKKVKANKIRKSGVILFESETGQDGATPITLTDSLANYTEYEVQYMLSTEVDGNIYQSTGRLSSNQLKFTLSMIRPGNTYVQIITQLMNITNNTLSLSHNWVLKFSNNVIETSQGITLRIVKVVGYK